MIMLGKGSIPDAYLHSWSIAEAGGKVHLVRGSESQL